MEIIFTFFSKLAVIPYMAVHTRGLFPKMVIRDHIFHHCTGWEILLKINKMAEHGEMNQFTNGKSSCNVWGSNNQFPQNYLSGGCTW